tara:strand:+ start:674 stop:1474 length:801 start_codon:yes stop_codon:yes gene_type:complete
MHKKIESELVSLAHSLLQMKNKEDVLALKEKAGEIYEKLSVLAFVDRYIATTAEASKTDILEKISEMDEIVEEEVISDLTTESPVPFVAEIEAPKESSRKERKAKKAKIKQEKKAVKLDKIEEEKIEVKVEETVAVEDLFSKKKEEDVVVPRKNTLEEELKDTISLDVTNDLFENAVRIETPRKSLNDVLIRKSLHIGLNDRIAFVKHLFDGSQEDFNRVISQLNSFKSEKEALKFVTKMVKLDYDWSGKEAYEERFITLITRKFA